jgi:hypothetical protein
MIKNADNECKKLFELEDRTSEALLLQFDPKEIITNALYIPNPCEIREIGLEFHRANREALQKRVREGLWAIFQRGSTWNEETECALENYMFKLGEGIEPAWCGKRIEGAWIYGFGDLFRFKQGEREKVERLYQEYWNPEERADFDKIGIILRDKTKQQYERR